MTCNVLLLTHSLTVDVLLVAGVRGAAICPQLASTVHHPWAASRSLSHVHGVSSGG